MIQPQTTAASSPPPVISTVDGPTLQVSNFLNAMHFQRQPKKWSSRLSQGSLATFDLDLRVLSATSNHPKSYLGENWLQGVKYSYLLWQIKSACRQPPGNLKWNLQSIERISVAPLLTQHAVTTKDPSLRLIFHRTLLTRKISQKRVHWAMRWLTSQPHRWWVLRNQLWVYYERLRTHPLPSPEQPKTKKRCIISWLLRTPWRILTRFLPANRKRDSRCWWGRTRSPRLLDLTIHN